MSQRRSEVIETLAAPLYFIAVLLIATPVLDFVSGVLPLRPDNIEWRFATVGLLSGFLLTPLLGILLAIFVAATCGHDLLQRIVAWANLTVAVAFLGLMVFFLLDILQLRSAVQEEAKAQFAGAAWKAMAKHLAFIASMAWLGVRGMKLPRMTAPQARRQAAVVIG